MSETFLATKYQSSEMSIGQSFRFQDSSHHGLKSGKSNKKIAIRKKDGEIITFQDLGRRSLKFCFLCERKFPTEALESRVTKKRIVEWRREHGYEMDHISPLNYYDYVPVCLFCNQFFEKSLEDLEAEERRRKKMEWEQGNIVPMIFSLEDRVVPCFTPFYGKLFNA